MTSYNEVNADLTTIASRHDQLGSYQIGFQEGDIILDKDNVFPRLMGSLENTQIETGHIVYTYTLGIADIPREDFEDADEVYSDTLQILTDFFAEFKNPQILVANKYEVETSATFEPVTWGEIDGVGWTVEIEIKCPYTFDACNAPLGGSPIEVGTCDPVSIKNAAGDVIETVASGGEYTIAGSGTVENSDASYSNTVNVGDTLILPDITVTDSDGSTSSLPSVQNVVCTPGADATVENSDTSYTNTVASGGTLVLPDITVTDSDGSTFTQPSVVNVVCSLAADGTVNVNSVFFDNVASGGTLNIQVRQSSGSTLIGSKQGAYFRIPDSVITLDNTDGTTLSTTNVLATDASTITAPDATAVIKNTLNAVLRSELVPSNVSEDIIIADATININQSDGTLIASATVTAEGSGVYNVADSTVNVVNTLGSVLSSNSVKATVTDTVLAPDANVENSDSSYTNTVASGGTLTLPDITVTDSDGSTFTQPSVVNVVCSLAPNPTVYCRPSNCVQSVSYANGDAAFSKEDLFEHTQTGKIQQIDHSVATPNHFNTLVYNDPEFGGTTRFTNDSGTDVFGTNPANTLIYDNLQGVIFDVDDFRNDNRRTIADAWTIAQAKSETLNGKTYATWYLAPIEYMIAVVDEDWTTTEPRLYNAFGAGVIAMSSTYFRGGIAGKYYISNSTSTSSGIVVKTPTSFNMIYMAFIEDGI